MAKKTTVTSASGESIGSKVINAILKGIDSLFDVKDFDSDKVTPIKKDVKPINEDGKQGVVIPMEYNSGKDVIIQVKLFEVTGQEDKFYVNISAPDCKTFDNNGKVINRDELDKCVDKFCETNFDALGSNEGPVDSSRRLRVSLKRVTGSTGDTIELTAIQANYHAREAMSDLQSILAADEFVENIGEDPSSFEVTQTDDDYDVNPIDEVNTDDTYEKLFSAAIEAYHNLLCIHWGAKGDGFFTLHDTVGSMCYNIHENIDYFAELIVEKEDKIPHITDYIDESGIEHQEGFTLEEGFRLASEILNKYVSVLDTYYVNVPHDVQSRLDDLIREYTKQSKYFLKRVSTQ